MKVKIGDKFYDSTEEPIMFILSSADKYQMSQLTRDERCLCFCPRSSTTEQIDEFMDCKEWREELGVELVTMVYRSEE